MYKEEKAEFKTDWYDVWMKQCKEFFNTADQQLKGAFADPEQHLNQIKQWTEMLKNQWQFSQPSDQQKMYENYWRMMSKMCSEASDLMINQWIKRHREEDPIKNTRELYELWLNCCQEVYQNAMHNEAYQKSYGDFMNAAIQYWKSVIPK